MELAIQILITFGFGLAAVALFVFTMWLMTTDIGQNILLVAIFILVIFFAGICLRVMFDVEFGKKTYNAPVAQWQRLQIQTLTSVSSSLTRSTNVSVERIS